jgi:hypothetical protein
MYAERVTSTAGNARWALGLAVALVTAPGVLVAQLLTADVAPSALAALVVSAVVAAVACAVPTRTARGTAALAGAAQLAGSAVLALAAPPEQTRSSCLSVVGRGADLGVRFALRADPGCPPGSVQAGPALAAAVAAVAAGLVVLLGHAVLATLTGVLVTAVRTGVEVVHRLTAALLPVLAGLLGVRTVPVLAPAVRPEPLPLTDRWQPGRLPRRGPPAGTAASA